MSNSNIVFFDTTLRDGEQSPGFSMKTEEKIALALQLEKLGVDVIEAGFPIASPGDFDAVQQIANTLKTASVCGLSRATTVDIDSAWGALKNAKRPRIHTFLASSDIHLKHKLKISREEMLENAIKAVKYARNLCDDVEFSAEDSVRTDLDFLCKVTEAVIKAGARTVNLPDTVGYSIPSEYAKRIEYVMNNVPNIDKAIISVHCHNDLGLAVSNSLAAIHAGARQVECTINGIGERAGNAALEELAMALYVRKDLFKGLNSNINTKEIYRTSRMLTSITGIECQPNKAVVGKNAFAHESGIHQDGVLKNPVTYEIMTPESVGIPENKLVLGKHSGRHAFSVRITDLGYNLEKSAVEKLFVQFKALADKKKEVFDEDIEALIYSAEFDQQDNYSLEYVCISSGDHHIPTATVTLKDTDGNLHTDASIGDGPVDAAFKTIERISGISSNLKQYRINAVTEGKDAQGEVSVTIDFDESGKAISAKGYSTDVLVASVKAYVNALNKFIARQKAGFNNTSKGI